MRNGSDQRARGPSGVADQSNPSTSRVISPVTGSSDRTRVTFPHGPRRRDLFPHWATTVIMNRR
ncbi:hypothetical protein Aglo03_01450 [Actinokineospora globicatena]|uniref:Uncharacterized protein n=1 Tax=Actinokineospora globicatena TaxID=103729 RepID=A0A9W6V6U8_9PSEU|nr:hypothetical protein Aglo03_01450 [Actinokineospora globicatena]